MLNYCGPDEVSGVKKSDIVHKYIPNIHSLHEKQLLKKTNSEKIAVKAQQQKLEHDKKETLHKVVSVDDVAKTMKHVDRTNRQKRQENLIKIAYISDSHLEPSYAQVTIDLCIKCSNSIRDVKYFCH